MGWRSSRGHSLLLTVGTRVMFKVKSDSGCVKTGASWKSQRWTIRRLLCSELQAHLGTDPRQSLLPTSLPRMPSTEVLPPASQEDNRPIGCITETRTENSASSCILRANLFPSPLPHTHWVPFPPQVPAAGTLYYERAASCSGTVQGGLTPC